MFCSVAIGKLGQAYKKCNYWAKMHAYSTVCVCNTVCVYICVCVCVYTSAGGICENIHHLCMCLLVNEAVKKWNCKDVEKQVSKLRDFWISSIPLVLRKWQ